MWKQSENIVHRLFSRQVSRVAPNTHVCTLLPLSCPFLLPPSSHSPISPFANFMSCATTHRHSFLHSRVIFQLNVTYCRELGPYDFLLVVFRTTIIISAHVQFFHALCSPFISCATHHNRVNFYLTGIFCREFAHYYSP